MIACYCRVSTQHQKNDSQRSEITRWLKQNSISLSEVRWFEEKESSRSERRPALEQMQQAIFEGNVRTVVVWKLDRLSRQLHEGINLLASWCERGIRVISVTQQIDVSGIVGRMVASVMFGLAEIEYDYRRERQAAGIRLAKQRGVYRGRQKGTTKAKPARAKELRDRGMTTREIANALGISHRTVFRYLKQAEQPAKPHSTSEAR